CEIRSKASGYVAAQSKLFAEHQSGYVFYRCRLTAGEGVLGVGAHGAPKPADSVPAEEATVAKNAPIRVFLGRPWRPYSTVVYIECDLGRHIRAEGWDNWRNPANEKTAWFGEFHSTGPGAN